MPIYELGYRKWNGRLIKRIFYPLAITFKGITLAFRSKLCRFTFMICIILSIISLLFPIVTFILLSRISESDIKKVLETLSQTGSISYSMFTLIEDYLKSIAPESINIAYLRLQLVSFAFYISMRSIAWLTLFIIIIAGAQLIANDLRGKSFLLYFSKPITILEYIVGKFLIVIFITGLVNLVPNVVAYLISVIFSPSIEILLQTYIIVPKLFLAYIVIVIPFTLLVLFFSSLTTRPYICVFIALTFLIGGEIFYSISQYSSPNTISANVTKESEGIRKSSSSWSMLFSITTHINNVVYYLFNIDDIWYSLQKSKIYIRHSILSPKGSLEFSIIYLIIISIFSFYMVYKKIKKQITI